MKKRDKKKETVITGQGTAIEAPKPRKKRKKAPVIIAALIVVIIIFRAVACSSGGGAGAVVTTANAVRGDIQESISTTGTVRSEEVSVIFAPVSGILDSVNVAAGDAVQAGDVLAAYNMDRLESSMRQSELQYEKSNANYDGVMADNAQNQAKLNEANVNLGVLNQQIEDTKAYLRSLQNELSESQRHTSNALAAESMNLSNALREKNSELGNLQAELKNLLEALESSPDTVDTTPLQAQIAGLQSKIADKEEEISDVNNAINYNSYEASTANNSDYIAELQQKISDAQEQLQHYETYKSEMQGQKSSSENSVLDSFDKTSYSADREMAGIAWEESAEDYAQAKDGICAEYAGIITECSAVSGSAVSSGVHLMTLESSENVKVAFQASKYDLAKLEIGQKVDVTISGNIYEGEISKINRMAEANASNTPMVGVEVHLLAPDDKIILGMDAKLVVYTKKAENTLMVPVEAINADKEGDFLYAVEGGIVVKKPIVCGISTDTYTEVLEGITEEDEIILMSYGNLEEGMPVTVMPVQ